LLGAFALGAVTAEEAAAVREHLATCAECQAEIAALWVAVDTLPALVDPMEPPPALRGRISEAILADVAARPVTPAAPAPPARIIPASAPLPMVLPAEPIRPARWWSAPAPWAAAAAILLLLSAGMLFWNLQLRDQIDRAPVPETFALAAADIAPDARGVVTYLPDDRLMMLSVRDLPALAPGEVYEVWLIEGDEAPVPAGVFDQSTAQHAIVADRALYDTLAITNEPGPLGTAAPTGEIVATASL